MCNKLYLQCFKLINNFNAKPYKTFIFFEFMENKFDFQEEFVVSELKRMNSKIALLQLPEGLKQEAIRLANYFDDNSDTDIIVSGETCWGGCDLSLDEAKNIGADLIIHYGHAPFIKRIDFPVLYIELKDKT